MHLPIALILSLSAPQFNIPAAGIKVEDTLSSNEDLENNCSLGCALRWRVEASSASPKHPVPFLDDARIETAWIAAENDPLPEIRFTFPPTAFSESMNSVRFDGFLLCGGAAGSIKSWRSYSRPHTLTIRVDGRDTATAELQDVRKDQFITFSDTYLKPGSIVSVRITSVFPGAMHHSVAVAALVPQGAH